MAPHSHLSLQKAANLSSVHIMQRPDTCSEHGMLGECLCRRGKVSA